MEGYIYILINSSMEGLVKIGKTTRNPEGRVKELSSATGVPTPFTLIYKEKFNDCDKAEKSIHERLELMGKRLTRNREFFTVPVYEAIKIVQEVQMALSTKAIEDTKVNTLGEDLLKEGLIFYLGLDDYFIDYQQALELFYMAVQMGCVEAHEYLAEMNYIGKGCKQDKKKALYHMIQSAKLKSPINYANVAVMYMQNEGEENELNTKKSLNLFFDYLKHAKVLQNKELEAIEKVLCPYLRMEN
ncbi:GIY-YIG nuclease family protein [Terribacillus saccharophilus]|uniref:GIY-YIG nuclease family protein n=1 Tax=Terribacillus saccharophilus TaxID=361277 RepID=UPI002989F575|nr:GIY-YIG nuclease family protein [Terribacillus saccharophilus]MCM3226627.1 GIY-YIG nuclease family protein [Terribacillus saccharophilus]